MIPPTSIDGTDITGATIDGTDVQEITVDGQTVFTAEALPVAYSNLVAWYPFDSSFYGGSNADDVTALFNSGQSGDASAFDATVNGATYQSSGGVTDINAGANSGAFDFDGSNDTIDVNPFNSPPNVTLCFWGKLNTTPQSSFASFITGQGTGNFQIDFAPNGDIRFNGSASFIIRQADTNYHHTAVTYDGSSIEVYNDGTSVGSNNGDIIFDELILGTNRNEDRFIDAVIDDVRVYNTVLTTQQVQKIVQNTQDPNNPVFP